MTAYCRSRTPPSTAKQTPPPSAVTPPAGPPSTVRELLGSGRSAEPLGSGRSQLELTPAPSTPGAPPGSAPPRVQQVTPPLLKDASPAPALHTLVSNRRPGVAAAIPRPFIDELFAQIEGHAEVALWTASTDDTGRPVVEQVDPLRRRFHHLIFRNPLWFTEPAHTKDLSLLGRPMEKVLLIENTPNCCKFHRNNSLLVEDFTPNSQNDRMLLTVALLIRDCAAAVRRGVSVPRFLQMRAQLQAGNMPIDDAYRHIESLDPLMQPPLGNFFYVKQMRHVGRNLPVCGFCRCAPAPDPRQKPHTLCGAPYGGGVRYGRLRPT
eukprot:gene56548-60684_t